MLMRSLMPGLMIPPSSRFSDQGVSHVLPAL